MESITNACQVLTSDIYQAAFAQPVPVVDATPAFWTGVYGYNPVVTNGTTFFEQQLYYAPVYRVLGYTYVYYGPSPYLEQPKDESEADDFYSVPSDTNISSTTSDSYYTVEEPESDFEDASSTFDFESLETPAEDTIDIVGNHDIEISAANDDIQWDLKWKSIYKRWKALKDASDDGNLEAENEYTNFCEDVVVSSEEVENVVSELMYVPCDIDSERSETSIKSSSDTIDDKNIQNLMETDDDESEWKKKWKSIFNRWKILKGESTVSDDGILKTENEACPDYDSSSVDCDDITFSQEVELIVFQLTHIPSAHNNEERCDASESNILEYSRRSFANKDPEKIKENETYSSMILKSNPSNMVVNEDFEMSSEIPPKICMNKWKSVRNLSEIVCDESENQHSKNGFPSRMNETGIQNEGEVKMKRKKMKFKQFRKWLSKINCLCGKPP